MKKNKDNTTNTPEAKKRVSIAREVTVEMEERKSIFLGHAKPVSTEEEAKAFVAAKKAEYADATHNVYAYLLNGGAIARFSDDGEPQGTAGMPVLNVLKMSGACDLAVVVTRYFGGILLGAGGLVRAYSASARQALDEAGIAVYEEFAIVRVRVSYSDYQKLTVALPKLTISEEGSEFGEDVTVICALEADRVEELSSLVVEMTNGKGSAEVIAYEERPSLRHTGI
ncbi:MAG: DUF1949 domain-containing protein [Ruminococcaceae bacterium]|nr:DUF1949 domain-containing protein [Oscillospiraceae bacterium]